MRPWMLPESARITAATQVWPCADATDVHMTDISAFAEVLGWLLWMNMMSGTVSHLEKYSDRDSTGTYLASPDPGPNAPLNTARGKRASCGSKLGRSWLSRRPRPPAYGYVSKSVNRTRHSLAKPSLQPRGPHIL
ncbi:hypothetical protein JB92DRAFT_1322096 [Gautieria morchelliformis]|nr:hypothetical protein JB92DRAFT_1322096 [Gautieria morchelliformis]